MPDYTLTQTADTVNATLVKGATYIPKAMVTVATIAARNAIATADKENGKVVRVLDDGSGNIAYYSWNSGGSTWDDAYFPVDPDLYDQVYTPTYSTPETVTQEITSLASTVLNGKLSAEVQGNTVVNILSDNVAGCEANTGWTASSGSIATDSSNEIEGTNCLKPVLGGSSDTYDYDILSMLVTGRYYFLSGHIKNGNATNIKLGLETDDQDLSTSVVTTTSYSRVGIVIAPTDFDTASSAVMRITVTGSAGQYAYFDALMLQEITSAEYALGASAMLTKYAYHRGTKSTDKIRVLCEGKNIFDKSKARLGGYYDAAGSWTASADHYSSEPIRVDPNTAYCHNRGANSNWNELDVNGNLIKNTLAQTVTTASNTFYIRTHSTQTNKPIDDFQIERGSVATSYVSYTSTSAVLPNELKRISSTVYDTWDANLGKHTKNTKKYTLLSGDIDEYNTTFVSFDRIRLSKNTDAIYYNNTSAYGDCLRILNFSYTIAGETDTSALIGTYRYFSSNTKYYLYVAKGTYADLATAQAALAGTEMIYQLATPVVTNYYPNILTAEPSGTIYVEPFVSDYDFYDSGCVVSNVTYPISSLAYVNIVNKVDGSLTPAALSTCTVAADGLSFTSTGISAEDLVDFGYNHMYLSTVPTLSYICDENLKATVVSNREDIGELDRKIEQVITQEKTRLSFATVTLGTISATTTYGLFIAPVACEIADVKFITGTSISTNNTDYWTMEVIDKGSAGSDTNVICTSNTTITSGSAITAYDARDLGAISATHGKLAQGDVVLVKFTKSGSATTMAEGMVMVSYLTGN